MKCPDIDLYIMTIERYLDNVQIPLNRTGRRRRKLSKDKEIEEVTKVRIETDSNAFSNRIKENLADLTKPDVLQKMLLGKNDNGEDRSVFDVYRYNREISLYENGHGGGKKGKKGKKKKGKKKYLDLREVRKLRFK